MPGTRSSLAGLLCASICMLLHVVAVACSPGVCRPVVFNHGRLAHRLHQKGCCEFISHSCCKFTIHSSCEFTAAVNSQPASQTTGSAVVNVAKTMFDKWIAKRAQTRRQSFHSIKQRLILKIISAHVAHKRMRQTQQAIEIAKCMQPGHVGRDKPTQRTPVAQQIGARTRNSGGAATYLYRQRARSKHTETFKSNPKQAQRSTDVTTHTSTHTNTQANMHTSIHTSIEAAYTTGTLANAQVANAVGT